MTRFSDDEPPPPVPGARRIWGGALPEAGRLMARRLNIVSNPTIPLPERMAEAEQLACDLRCSPHRAWRLACDTRIRLGWPQTGIACWWAIVRKQPPDGAWPTAEAWLKAAGLTVEGEKAPDPPKGWVD